MFGGSNIRRKRWLELVLLLLASLALFVTAVTFAPAIDSEPPSNISWEAWENATFTLSLALGCAYGAIGLAFFGSIGCLLAAIARHGDLPRVGLGFVAAVKAVATACMVAALLLATDGTRTRIALLLVITAASTALAVWLWRAAVHEQRRTLAELEQLQREQVAREGGIVPALPDQESSARNLDPAARRIDALHKLAELRERGALTQQEFERQKSELLRE